MGSEIYNTSAEWFNNCFAKMHEEEIRAEDIQVEQTLRYKQSIKRGHKPSSYLQGSACVPWATSAWARSCWSRVFSSSASGSHNHVYHEDGDEDCLVRLLLTREHLIGKNRFLAGIARKRGGGLARICWPCFPLYFDINIMLCDTFWSFLTPKSSKVPKLWSQLSLTSLS